MSSDSKAIDLPGGTPLVDRLLAAERSQAASTARVDFRDVIDRAWERETGDQA